MAGCVGGCRLHMHTIEEADQCVGDRVGAILGGDHNRCRLPADDRRTLDHRQGGDGIGRSQHGSESGHNGLTIPEDEPHRSRVGTTGYRNRNRGAAPRSDRSLNRIPGGAREQDLTRVRAKIAAADGRVLARRDDLFVEAGEGMASHGPAAGEARGAQKRSSL